MRKAALLLLLMPVCGPAARLFAATDPVSFFVSGTYPKGNKVANGLAWYFQSAMAEKLDHAFPCARVLTASDVENLMSFERQRDLLGGLPADLAEIGGALGVDYLISVTVTPAPGGNRDSTRNTIEASDGVIPHPARRCDPDTRVESTRSGARHRGIATESAEL